MSRSLIVWSLLGLAVLAAGAACPVRAANEQLAVSVADATTGQPIACRVHLWGPNGKKARRADATTPFWVDHFVFPGAITLKLPLGQYTFEMERGPEYVFCEGHFLIERSANDSKDVNLRRIVDMPAEGWWPGDFLVRRPVKAMPLLMAAEDLHLAQVVTWWNDKSDWKSGAWPKGKNPVVLTDKDRSYHVQAGGYSQAGTEVLCFGLPAPALRPGSRSESPPLLKHLVELRREHPDLWVDLAAPFGWDMPLLVAHGQVQSIQVLHRHFCRSTMLMGKGDRLLLCEAPEGPFRQKVPVPFSQGRPPDPKVYPGPNGYARWGQDIYFKLLDCGLRIPPSAGSGSGMVPNPVGYNRLYVHLDGPWDYRQWWENLRAGQVVVTNGPLLRPKVEGQLPGHVFRGEKGKMLELEIALSVSSRDPISYLEIIQDGRVQFSLRFEEYAKTGRLPKLEFRKSGWFLLRVVSDVPDTYRFAMTAPWYVEFGGQKRISRAAAQFFVDWVDQRTQQIARDDSPEREEVLGYHRQAKDFWQDLVKRANAD